MLRGMELDKFIPLFSQADVSLEEFLTIDDDGLEKLGIELPYQKNLIRLGLHNFFCEKWSNKSIWLPENIKYQISPVDLVYILANILRHVIVLKCQLKYLKQLDSCQDKKQISYDSFTLEHFKEFQNQIQMLAKTMSTMEITKRPLKIPKQTQPIKCNTMKQSRVIGFAKSAIKVLPVILILTTLRFLYRK